MRTKPQQGFTLIEVLVALVILGIGVSSILVAYSGSLKLMRQSNGYESALLLARSKMDETWAAPETDIKGDEQEERYNGTLYGYRITLRPTPILEPALEGKVTMPVELQEILVEVFWGEEAERREYRLYAYRLVDAKPAPALGTTTEKKP